jgi:dynein heavy chain, axonemal
VCWEFMQVGWQAIYDSQQPASEQLPAPWSTQLSSFQKLVVLRVVRPDKLVPAVRGFVAAEMGQKYVQPPPFDLARWAVCCVDTTHARFHFVCRP